MELTIISVESMVELTLSDVSKHLTFNVIDKAFKLRIKTEDDVQSVIITRAAPAGEGIISAVYRITVVGNKHTASFIAKGLVNDLLLRKSLNSTKYFKREVVFFSKILPLLIEFQKSLGAKEDIQRSVPKCYGCHLDGSNDYILMEDLSENNFKPISENPTKNERDFTLKVLAHLHAISLALRVKSLHTFIKISNLIPEIYYIEENCNWYTPFLQNAVKIDSEVMSQCVDVLSIYYRKFDDLVKGDLYKQLVNICSTRGDHPVFCHGDAWCPNFLCSEDRAVAIDFQFVRCASPATDLAYFIFLCSNLCCNKTDFMIAVDTYYNFLQYYLRDMGMEAEDVFTRQDLNNELKIYGKFGILACLTSIPLLAGQRCDTLEEFEAKFSGLDKIPLEKLWPLTPITSKEVKMRLVNAVRIAVDTELI